MNEKRSRVVAGVVLGEQETVTLEELAGLCTVERSWVVELVEQGVLEPITAGRDEWFFPAAMLGRVQTAARLRRDLELNAAGVALALDLLDEVESLRARLRTLETLF